MFIPNAGNRLIHRQHLIDRYMQFPTELANVTDSKRTQIGAGHCDGLHGRKGESIGSLISSGYFGQQRPRFRTHYRQDTKLPRSLNQTGIEIR